MGRDESGTLARLRAHRKEHLEPALAQYDGRLIKLTGDGTLSAIASAVDAPSAAIEFPQTVTDTWSERHAVARERQIDLWLIANDAHAACSANKSRQIGPRGISLLE
jgi:class 3 adenylate cyclase